MTAFAAVWFALGTATGPAVSGSVVPAEVPLRLAASASGIDAGAIAFDGEGRRPDASAVAAGPSQEDSSFFSTLRPYIRSHREAVDYGSLIKDRDVVLMGEVHPNVAVKRELAGHMKEFKEAGVTHLGLEMISHDHQPLVNRYLKCKAEKRPALRKELEAILDKEWGWVPDAYMEAIDAAKDNGIRVVALDMPRARQEHWKRELASGRLKVYDEDGKDLSWCDVCAVGLILRNKYMGVRISEVARDPKAKMIVLTGEAHADEMDGIPAWMPKGFSGRISAYSISSSGDFEKEMPGVYELAIEALGWARDRFFVPLPPKATHYSGLIRLPEEGPSPAALDTPSRK